MLCVAPRSSSLDLPRGRSDRTFQTYELRPDRTFEKYEFHPAHKRTQCPCAGSERTFRKYEVRPHRTFEKYEFAVVYMKVVENTPFLGVFGRILTREACRSRISSQFSGMHGTRSRLYDHKIPIFTLAKLSQAGTHQKVSETKTQLQLKQGSCAAIISSS